MNTLDRRKTDFGVGLLPIAFATLCSERGDNILPQPELGWVWLTQSERTAAQNSLSSAGPDGTRDELGFGVIHFAYADRFFPGTSVQHTSLRYIWFICWALQEMAERSAGGLFSNELFVEIEDRIGHRLIEKYGDGDRTGIIGGRVLRKGGSPVSKPSAIYWSALRTWGLLTPLKSTGAAPYRGDLIRHWDALTRRDGLEVDVEEPRGIFLDPPPMPSGWRRKKGELSFDLDLTTQEDEKIRTRWSKLRDQNGNTSLLSRLAERRKLAPSAMNSAAVRQLCSQTEIDMLKRAEQAGSLVCVARALYIAMVGDLKRRDGDTVAAPDQMLAATLATHQSSATALDLDLLAKDVPALGDLKFLLAAVQEWVSRGSADYVGLQPTFLTREHALKDDRALLLEGSDLRRRSWRPGEPWPLKYRWDKVAGFLQELAPTA